MSTSSKTALDAQTAREFAWEIWDSDEGLRASGWDDVERVIEHAMAQARAEGFAAAMKDPSRPYFKEREQIRADGYAAGVSASARRAGRFVSENVKDDVMALHIEEHIEALVAPAASDSAQAERER